MDSETIKALLQSQERAYKSAMDIIVDNMKTKISTLENTISEITTSLEYSQAEVEDLKQANKLLAVTVKELQASTSSNTTQLKALERRFNYQEDYSRRNNLRFIGVRELQVQGGETWEQTSALVISLLQDKLQLPPINLERAHRIGEAKPGQPRVIVARFEKYSDREAVLRNCTKFKGTNIFVTEDLCQASQAVRDEQLPKLKQARAEGKIAYFRHTKLYIREKNDRTRTRQATATTSDSDLPRDEQAADERRPMDVAVAGGTRNSAPTTGLPVAAEGSDGMAPKPSGDDTSRPNMDNPSGDVPTAATSPSRRNGHAVLGNDSRAADSKPDAGSRVQNDTKGKGNLTSVSKPKPTTRSADSSVGSEQSGATKQHPRSPSHTAGTRNRKIHDYRHISK